jgi:hypothetical protein
VYPTLREVLCSKKEKEKEKERKRAERNIEKVSKSLINSSNLNNIHLGMHEEK